jgi:hypothetical protein
MLLIYAEHDSPRLAYILQVLFRDVSVLEYRFTSDRAAYLHHEGPRLNYSRERITENDFFLPASGLLSETGTREQVLDLRQSSAFPYFFPTSDGDFPFDVFAASFYLVSRYEEYLPHYPDRYGRYDHRQSLACREGFLDRPLVNEWMKAFRLALHARFPGLFMPEPVFRFQPTYDIDVAYAYRCRGWARLAGGWLRDLLHWRIPVIAQRIRVSAGKEADPYDVFEWLDALHLRYRLKPVYFFLLAARQVGYDKNIDPRKKVFRELVAYHGMGYPIGVHPSWQSGDDGNLLAAEKALLESLTGRETGRSRQHYIRMSLPHTYQALLAGGISEDYSMGYGSINGFRASIAAPHAWYDLSRERSTALRIHPFCFMDANARFEEGLAPGQAFEQLRVLHDRVKKSGGTMSVIFHNSFLGTHPDYRGWREVYELFLEEVVYWDI